MGWFVRRAERGAGSAAAPVLRGSGCAVNRGVQAASGGLMVMVMARPG
jgi:hypothetical protein